MSFDPLEARLLVRIQGKIESRTRRPWFDLQRSYYHRDNRAIKTPTGHSSRHRSGHVREEHARTSGTALTHISLCPPLSSHSELRLALEHFHVHLSDSELNLLFARFPKSLATGTGFDFRAFAERLYPRNQLTAEPNQEENQTTQTQVRQQQQEEVPVPQPQPTQQYSPPPVQPSLAFQPQQIYGQPLFQRSQPLYQQSQPLPQQYPVSAAPVAAAFPRSFRPSASAPQLGQLTTLKQNFVVENDATRWYQGGVDSSLPSIAPSRAKRASTAFRPRLTYNRPAQQRFSTTPFETSFVQPYAMPYPRQELATASRFGMKQPPRAVDVPRRHNISRQYNRM